MNNRLCPKSSHRIKEVRNQERLEYVCLDCPLTVSVAMHVPRMESHFDTRKLILDAERDWYIKELES